MEPRRSLAASRGDLSRKSAGKGNGSGTSSSSRIFPGWARGKLQTLPHADSLGGAPQNLAGGSSLRGAPESPKAATGTGRYCGERGDSDF